MPTVKVKNTKKGIKVSFKSVKGAKKYQIYRKLKNNNMWHLYKITTTTTYTDKSVKKGKIYDYTARAVNGKNISFYRTGKRIKRS